MADQTLVMMLNDVRGKTLRLLEGVQEAEARFVPPGLQNSILWHAGHVVVVNEHLGVMHASGRPAACPAGWVEMFGWQSKPATVTQWPTLAEVVAQLKEQLGRFGPALEAMQPEQLDRPLQHGTGAAFDPAWAAR